MDQKFLRLEKKAPDDDQICRRMVMIDTPLTFCLEVSSHFVQCFPERKSLIHRRYLQTIFDGEKSTKHKSPFVDGHQ